MKTINPNFHKLIAVDDDSFVEKFGVDKYILLIIIINLIICLFVFFFYQGCIYLLNQNTGTFLNIFTV